MSKWMLIMSLMVCVLPLEAQTIYRYVDSQGNIHFTDKPRKGAQPVTLPPVQTFSTPVIPQPVEEAKPQEEEQRGYQSLTILAPTNGETIRNNQGLITVNTMLKPKLKSGDKYQMIYDGTPLGDPQPSSSFILNNVFRGAHNIMVQIVDAKGKVLITSETITVFMHRPRVGMVRN